MFPGPTLLGRGLVILPGQDVPPAFASAPRVCIDEDVLASPHDAVRRLHHFWATRTPAVIEFAVPQSLLATAQTEQQAPYALSPAFEFAQERLHFLVWANNYDMRNGNPVWWRTRKALRLGATDLNGETAGDVLVHGEAVWCDGGPRGPLPLDIPILHRESIERGRLHATGPAATTQARLAPDQLAAVQHRSGAARVIAPAGSGKTRVLTERLKYLLGTRQVEREIVTTVAYNAKAAEELRERCLEFSPNIRTIHALGLSIARQAGDFNVIEERETRALLDSMVEAQRRRNQDVLAPYIEALSTVRIGLRPPEEIEAERDDIPGFTHVYQRYRKALQERQALDFDEQIYTAITLLLTSPELRRQAQARARHLLVDEFQDLTPAYLLLLRLLASPAYQVFGVGDDDQVIYGYAGATPTFLLRYEVFFPNAARYALETNYRCPKPVVSGAVNLLARNKVRVKKNILCGSTADDSPSALQIYRLPNAELSTALVRVIEEWLVQETPIEEIAVLGRVNSALLPVAAACAEKQIDVRTTLDTGVLQRTGLRAALAYLRIGISPSEIRREDLLETVKRPSRRLSRPVLERLSHQRIWSREELARLAASLDEQNGERLDAYLSDINMIARAVAQADTTAVLHTIRSRVGLDRALRLLDGGRSTADRSTHQDDLDSLLQVAAIHPDPATFESWLREILSRRPHGPALLLSTIHRVKGREWDRVAVFGVHDGLLPHQLAGNIEEERRVFHVAVTRGRVAVAIFADKARKTLFLHDLEGKTLLPHARAAAAAAARSRPPRTDGPTDSAPFSSETSPTTDVSQRNRQQAKTSLQQNTTADPSGNRDADPVTDKIREALAAWRRTRAIHDEVPAYVIMANKHLEAIATRRPSTHEELSDCPGIGPQRLDRFGDEILEILDTITRANSQKTEKTSQDSRQTISGTRRTTPPTDTPTDTPNKSRQTKPRKSTPHPEEISAQQPPSHTASDIPLPPENSTATTTTSENGDTDPVTDKIREALAAWRRTRAIHDEVPAYVIMANKHLEAIATRRPSTHEELSDCPGIGPQRLLRFGDEILAIIKGTMETKTIVPS